MIQTPLPSLLTLPLQAKPCPEIHGDSGLDLLHGRRLPASRRQPLAGKAVIHMHEQIHQFHQSRYKRTVIFWLALKLRTKLAPTPSVTVM